MRIDLDKEENNIRNYVNANYLVIVATTVMFAVVISWRLTTTYFPSKDNYMTATSLTARMRTWILRRGRREQATERFVSESEEDVDLKKYTYIEELGGKFEMVVYNIDFDRMFIVPAVCPARSEKRRH